MSYCHSCDKIISKKVIKKHNKSKTHLYFYINFVINKYYIGDVLWRDFGNIIHEYIDIYNNKFNCFSVKVDFQLNKENFSFSIDNFDGQTSMYKFINIGWIYYKFYQSKIVKDFLQNLKIESLKIDDVILTIISKSKTMKRYHLLNQPRSVLESKILKHIHNSNFSDKFTKYRFLSKIYGIT